MQTKGNVLITGASSGIGLELAKIFARNFFNFCLVARNQNKLIEIKNELENNFNIKVKILIYDLAIPSAPFDIFNEIKNENIEIDILVNNAGFGTYGNFYETDLQTELNEIQVNITALTHLTKLFLKEMIKRNEGKILNVASTAAFQPGPLMAVYYATKAYVVSFSEAIANELRNTNIKITTLCPGPTKTNFQKTASLDNSRQAMFANYVEPHKVAEYGYKALMNNKTLAIYGLTNRIVANAVRFIPRKIVTNIARLIQEKKSSNN